MSKNKWRIVFDLKNSKKIYVVTAERKTYEEVAKDIYEAYISNLKYICRDM